MVKTEHTFPRSELPLADGQDGLLLLRPCVGARCAVRLAAGREEGEEGGGCQGERGAGGEDKVRE